MFACEICDRQFFYKNSVNRHFRREHINKESRRRLKCTECDHECRFYQDLRTHIYVDHGIVCKVERRMFSDFEEFNTWKKKLEETTHYMYVKHSSSKISASTNERKTYYVCHRTGTFQSGSCGKRKLKRQGSNKINASCPSTMEVVESLTDGTVKLVLWKTHVGHNAEVSRTFLSTNERNWLAARISEGASYQKIMNEIQNLGSKGGRMRFIKSQDIRNMRKNLINSRNRNILSDIRSWVKSAQALVAGSMMIYFKDKNVSDTSNTLSSKGTMLIIMSKYQEEVLKKFGSGFVCMDATHCQESYEYQLITLYVADNAGHWCPVVYCITNVVSCETIRCFITKVKHFAGEIRCSVFISDEKPSFFESWCEVMGLPKQKLIHLWCLDKSWKENILKLQCPDNVKSMIYKTMKIMLTEENEMSFEKMIASFSRSLQYDSRLSEFSAYFQNDYANKINIWAGCYRKIYGLNFESETILETLHKRLNKEYHDGVNAQKIKDCLTSLISISHSCPIISRNCLLQCTFPNENRLRCIQESHKRGVCIKRTEVVEATPSLYRVLYSSEKSKIESYTVKFCNIDKCNCLSLCDICKICCHEYSCTCLDYVANFNICEHIHACAIIKKQIKVDLSAETDAPLDSFVEEVICEEEIICNVDNLSEESGCDELKIEIDEDDDCKNSEDFTMDEESSKDVKLEIDPISEFELTTQSIDDEPLSDSTSPLYYEPFTFIAGEEMSNYEPRELQLTQDGLQIVAFKENEFEAVLVNDDEESSFGDSCSVYEDVVPHKTAIIALGFSGEGSDSYIFRRFDDNTIIRHKVDSLFTLADFNNTDDNDISVQLNSDIGGIEDQDFESCYSVYDPNEDDSLVLSL